ncbi:MAG: ankyrin repeat domain-containing protein [Wolbachia sp.]
MDKIQQRELNEQLNAAIQDRNAEQVRQLVEAGADVNSCPCGITPLHAAIDSGCEEIVEFLLDKGATGGSLCLAVGTGNRDMVEFLLARGESVHENLLGYAALRSNAVNGCKGMVELLLAKGADINIAGNHGLPLSHAKQDELSLFGDDDVNPDIAMPIVHQIAKLETIGLLVKEKNLQLRDELINTSDGRRNDCLQYLETCKEEAKKIERENKPLYDFLRESNIDNLVGIWERNENIRGKFGNQESLQEQYPEYADILINNANGVKKEIFLHNHKPLIDALSTHYECDFKAMTFAGIENFFKVHKGDIVIELVDIEKSLIEFVNFEDIKERHVPKLELQTFAKVVRKNAHLDNPNAEQHRASSSYCSIL